MNKILENTGVYYIAVVQQSPVPSYKFGVAGLSSELSLWQLRRMLWIVF